MHMKRLIICLYMGLLTSCVQKYDAVTNYGQSIVIRDSDGLIEQALERGDEFVSVVTSHLEYDDEYRSMTYLHSRDTLMFYEEYVDGKKYTGFLKYRLVKTSTISKR
jgi:hypothetical protein